jgi:hypothetical protein
MLYDYLIFYQKESSYGKADASSYNLKYHLKEVSAKEKDNDLDNQLNLKY